MATVPFPWPAREVVEWLVQKSSGYFIFASTIIKFIDDKDFRPTERLKVIMGIKESDGGSPFAALDQLYTQILSQVKARPLLLRLLTIMGTDFQSIIRETNFECTIGHIEQLLQLEPGDVKLTLRALQSLVYTSESGSNHDNWLSDGHIFFHHASFHDFLQDPQRAGIYYIGSVARRHDLSCQILKAFSYNSHPRMRGPNLNYPYGVDDLFNYAVSSEPSADLVTLLYSFNPVFLFRADCYHGLPHQTIDMVIDWLKRSQPLSEALIQLWEDYRFMQYCQIRWFRCESRFHKTPQITPEDWNQGKQILLQAPPSLIKILQAIVCITSCQLLLNLHVLLGFSWDELRMAICPLLPFISQGTLIANLLIVAKDPTAFPIDFHSIARNLTCGAFRVMLQIVNGEAASWVSEHDFEGWPRYLLHCPQSLNLLQDMYDVEPLLTERRYLWWDYEYILQWLKSFPQPPLELIRRFEGYMQREGGPIACTISFEGTRRQPFRVL
ncbi:hypothetical protein K438DRAFT_641333 [Mycena galopus ATCC 62051]|nr:hypothetical protein K438DRAFT_641333 [Mycena galopus ATCC 62051]